MTMLRVLILIGVIASAGCASSVSKDLSSRDRGDNRTEAKDSTKAEKDYLKGQEFYSLEKYEEATEWYLKAAAQGHAVAQYSLGLMYYSGRGVKENGAEAVGWFRKAADQGYSMAQSKLGHMYDNGHGVRVNYSEAMRFYLLAAEQDNASAFRGIGGLYLNGQGVEKNREEALKYYRKAAKLGDKAIQKWLDEQSLR